MNIKNREIKLGTMVETPNGVIKVGLVKYDPKKDEYFYSVFGSKSKWYHEKEVVICKDQPKRRLKKLKSSIQNTKKNSMK